MTVSPDELQKMRDARRSALLAKWSAGARLSPDERAEIADLIGEITPAAPAAQAAPPPPAPIAPAGPALVLESPPVEAVSSRSGCKHPLIPGTPYESTYGVTVRQIKRWRAAGSAHQPPTWPPLDEPAKMGAWYRTVMKRRVPPRLVELEEAAPSAPAADPVMTAKTSPTAPPPAPVVAPPAASPPRLPSLSSTVGLSTGYAATLNRLREAEAIAAQRYTDAVASPDPDVRASASALKREWMDLADTVRAYERDRGKVLRESDEIWDKDAVLEAITSVHNVIAPGVRRLWRTIRRRHPQFHALTSTQQDEVFAKEADALFAVLLNTSFTKHTLPDAEAPADLREDPETSTPMATEPVAA